MQIDSTGDNLYEMSNAVSWQTALVSSFFFQKARFDISCKLTPLETICMKCLMLFPGKKRKISTVCHLLMISSESGIVCVKVLRPSHPNGVMSSAVSLPDCTFTGQA